MEPGDIVMANGMMMNTKGPALPYVSGASVQDVEDLAAKKFKAHRLHNVVIGPKVQSRVHR